jgi:hypothetical protein
MKNVANTIEDLLEILAGMKQASKIQIESSDATIMHSIARQVFKGTALTDRQFALMKEKLQAYRDQFVALEYDFDRAVETLRQPLRNIDRSKFIKVVETSDVFDNKVYESYKSNWKWICVRFPFSKKLIMKINEINPTKDYYHEKGSHTHYFRLNEKNTFSVIEKFKDSEFEIDSYILDFYEKICKIKNDRDLHVPSIIGLELVNVRPSVIEYAENIALRSTSDMLFKPNEYRVEDILSAVDQLDRYPLLIVLDEKHADEQLYTAYNFYKNFLPAESQSVLFRLDSSANSEFNQMVKDYRLNNWVDKNTKVVYINTNKLPKVLFNSDWRPITAFTFESRINRVVDYYIKDYCDLIMFYDDEVSPLRRYSRYYG